LEFDEPLGAIGARLLLAELALELGDLLIASVRHPRHRTALSRRRAQLSGVALLAPRRQVGRVQPFTPQQGGDGTLLPRAGVGLAQDPDLLRGGVLAASRLRRHLGRLGHHADHGRFLDRPRH
jgi:hypothetical protein